MIKPLISNRYVIFLGVALVLLLFLWSSIKTLLIMSAFVIIGTLSVLYQRFAKVSLGIELNMMGMVVTGMLFGSLPAFIVGSVTFALSMILNEHLYRGAPVSFAGILLVSLLIPLFSDMNVLWAGMTLTIIYDIVIGIGYISAGSTPGRVLLFIGTHLLFNFWAFSTLAPRLISWLS